MTKLTRPLLASVAAGLVLFSASSVQAHDAVTDAETVTEPPAVEPAATPLPPEQEPGITVLTVAPEAIELPREKYELTHLVRDTKAVTWPLIGLGAAITATRIGTLVSHPSGFSLRHEGWFGRNTQSLGMDKLHHGFKTYVIADVLQGIIAKKTGDRRSAAYTGALLGLGMMTYGELFDGFSKGHGWSNEDMMIHVAGAGVALLRNGIPGMRDKLDFRMEMRPSLRNDALQLVNQLDDRKYLFALQLSGFKKLKKGPLRFAELHLGYYGRGFTETERLRGDPLRRKIFFGIGLNVQEILFGRKSTSRSARLARGVLDYIQPPYTSVEVN